MLQVVAGLTVVFVGYVLYEVFKTVSSESSQSSQVKSPPPAAVAANPEEPAKAAPVAEAKKTTPEPVKAAVESKKADTPADESKGAQLIKDPVSGETGPAPTNYRFAKKWVKEALVAEGLLDKVYKTADLDEAGAQKVKVALEKFKGMKKYHG